MTRFRIVAGAIAFAMGTFQFGLIANAQNEPAAPFGLVWGASEEAIRSLGVKLTSVDTKSYGKSYTASNLPVVLDDAEMVFLEFGFQNKLYRIGVLGDKIDNDRGQRILARFGELEQALESKYGKGRRFERRGKYYEEPDRFLMGIADGDSYYYTLYEKEPISVTLKIAADHGSSSQYVIVYEHDELTKQFEEDKAAKEKGAL